MLNEGCERHGGQIAWPAIKRREPAVVSFLIGPDGEETVNVAFESVCLLLNPHTGVMRRVNLPFQMPPTSGCQIRWFSVL